MISSDKSSAFISANPLGHLCPAGHPVTSIKAISSSIREAGEVASKAESASWNLRSGGLRGPWEIYGYTRNGTRIHNKLERSTTFNGKTHENPQHFDWAMVMTDISIETMAIEMT